jgi:hypothetical protein
MGIDPDEKTGWHPDDPRAMRPPGQATQMDASRSAEGNPEDDLQVRDGDGANPMLPPGARGVLHVGIREANAAAPCGAKSGGTSLVRGLVSCHVPILLLVRSSVVVSGG